ncbi:tail length tape measure protein [Salicola phage CGphi29]|uniref:tail length tape measure protein n=1 Tax=Salicola phage CGphi29 TaxID=754067 RepID=UPI0002C055FE|nr:tail length tape measure protein [Salicola phage CGphi29]AGH31829.1 hypothetical protein SLPG_00035 [Salicola phage CGphi29]
MTTLARLGFDVDTDPMRRASREMGNMSQQAGRTERSTKGAASGVRRAGSASQAAVSQFQRLGSAVKAAAGAMALVGTARQIRSTIRQTAQISELADVAGVSAERIQELSKSFSDMAGIAESATTGALRRFNRRLGLAEQGTGAAGDTFEQLGISITNAAGEMRATEPVLDEAIEQLGGIENESRRAARASELFGEDAGPQIAAALAQGTGALREQIQELHEHGRIVSNEQTAAVRDANDELNRMTDILSTRLSKALADNSDEIMTLADSLFTAAEAAGNATENIAGFLQSLDDSRVISFSRSVAEMIPLYHQVKSLFEEDLGLIGELPEMEERLASINKQLEDATDIPAYDALRQQAANLANQIEITKNNQFVLNAGLRATEERAEKAALTVRTVSEEMELLGKSIPNHDFATLAETMQAVNAAAESRSAVLLQQRLEGIRKIVDPTRESLQELGKNLDALERSDLPVSTVEQYKIELLKAAEGGSVLVDSIQAVTDATKDRIDELNNEGEDAGGEFASGFERQAERIGDSLADALMSGDWDGVGSSIGASVGSVLSDRIGENLSASLSEQFGKSIGSALGSGIGAAVGGAVGAGVGQAAGSLLDDVLGGSDYDPTEARQASQGTGTVLGSINAKSDSIDSGISEISEATSELVNINTGMLRSLEQVQNGISRAAAIVAQDRGGVDFAAGVGKTNTEQAKLGLGGFLGGNLLGTSLLGGVTDDIVGALDDALGGALSDVGNALFGGDRDVVDEGIRIIGGSLTELMNNTVVQAFATIREDGGLFGSDDEWDKFKALPESTARQFSAVFRDLAETVTEGADALGVLPGKVQKRLDEFAVETQQISLEGLDASEKAEEINAVFSSIFDDLVDDVVPYLEDFQNAGEGLGETMARLASQVGVMEELALTLGNSIESITGRSRAEAATDLASQLGGTEQFAQAIAGLEDQFLSESEQFEANSRRLGKALGDLPLPETRDGYLELIRAQDLATQSGRENAATILRLRDSADDYYDTLESNEEERLEKVRQREQELTDSLRASSDEALSDLRESVDARKSELQDQLDAELEAIQAREERRLEANQMALDAAKAGLSEIEDAVKGITDAADSLRDSFEPLQDARRSRALESLRSALETGELESTGESAQIAAEINKGQFETRAAFEREQGKTLNLLGQLEEEGQSQLSAAEQAVEQLKDQTDEIKRQAESAERQAREGHQDEISRLDSMLEKADSWLEAIRGVEEGVLSLPEAFMQAANAIGREEEKLDGGSGGSSEPITDAQQYSGMRAVEELYQDLLGREIGKEGREYFAGDLAAGQSISDIERSIRNSDEYQDLHGFAGGGIADGPRSGYPAELHGKEAIVPIPNGSIPVEMRGGGMSNDEILKELREIRRYMRQTTKNTNDAYEQLERWDRSGLPEERSLV